MRCVFYRDESIQFSAHVSGSHGNPCCLSNKPSATDQHEPNPNSKSPFLPSLVISRFQLVLNVFTSNITHPQMNMSPTRMPQAQGMLGGNVVAPTNQTQFMAQTQFPPNTNAMNVNMGQPNTQPAVSQVRASTRHPSVVSPGMTTSPLNPFLFPACVRPAFFPSSSRTLTYP